MNETQPIRVMTVDDHEILRSGIRFSLRAYKDLELVGHSVGQKGMGSCLALDLEVARHDTIDRNTENGGLERLLDGQVHLAPRRSGGAVRGGGGVRRDRGEGRGQEERQQHHRHVPRPTPKDEEDGGDRKNEFCRVDGGIGGIGDRQPEDLAICRIRRRLQRGAR